ncbi:hypothetical protein DPMN_099518 [Dreissena polymorpha]|uniref:Uncharacterized protein n=1 Tax=Dreissena polymorpha TaxID=45954 RepID=A0A9D4LFR9_DREPO|nr:hypothetical protein DPMN_099518 [Dreissena polymorpha]
MCSQCRSRSACVFTQCGNELHCPLMILRNFMWLYSGQGSFRPYCADREASDHTARTGKLPTILRGQGSFRPYCADREASDHTARTGKLPTILRGQGSFRPYCADREASDHTARTGKLPTILRGCSGGSGATRVHKTHFYVTRVYLEASHKRFMVVSKFKNQNDAFE